MNTNSEVNNMYIINILTWTSECITGLSLLSCTNTISAAVFRRGIDTVSLSYPTSAITSGAAIGPHVPNCPSSINGICGYELKKVMFAYVH
jgi:hypothetical protein